jgi:glycosyltransferase involved in cell wall biosynthesis
MAMTLVDTTATSVVPIVPIETRKRTITARVLHVINGEHYSGAERVQDLLAQRLPDHGYEAAFACLKPGRFATMRTYQDAKLFDLPMGSRLDVRVARNISKLVQAERFAVIHTHTPRAALIGAIASKLSGVPLVHHVHSPTSNDSTRRVINNLNAKVERAALRRASAVIAVSQSMGAYAEREGVPWGIVHVVPNGVPVQGALIEKQPPRSTWTIGSVALIRPRKGFEVLLETISQLKREGAPVRLRAVGAFETAEYEIELKRRATELGLDDLIQWTGFTRDVRNELAKMDLFVLPSLFGEGLPMVILEAMAAGVPVIGTDVEGTPEAICDGVDGLIVPPGDASALASAIRRIINGQAKWHELRTNAYERQAEQFSDAAMAAGVARVYRQVLAR